MIKVNFKHPAKIYQHGIVHFCMFALCNCYDKVNFENTILYFGDSNAFVPNELIKSIEHVKPTDL